MSRPAGHPPLSSAWRSGGARTRVALVLAIVVVSAACFAAIKAGAPFAPPLRFAALRLLIGGGALLALLPLVRQPLLPPRRFWPGLAALALLASGFAYGAMFASPRLAGAGIASVLGNTQPLIALALAVPLLGERMTRGTWAALSLGLAGVLLIAVPALTASGAFAWEGAVLALASAAGLAVGGVLVKLMKAGAYALTLAAWQLLLGSLPLLAASSLLEAAAPTRWTPTFVALLLFLALLGSSFLTAAWYSLLQRGEVGCLSLFFYLVPVVGLGLAALLFGERVTPVQGVGVALIVAGTLVLTREGRRDLASPSPRADVLRTPRTIHGVGRGRWRSRPRQTEKKNCKEVKMKARRSIQQRSARSALDPSGPPERPQTRSQKVPPPANRAEGIASSNPNAPTQEAAELRRQVLNRLASAHGHLAEVREMVARGDPCPQVAYQLRAVKGALEQIERQLAAMHVRGCVAHAGMRSREELADALLELWSYNPSQRRSPSEEAP